MPKTDNATPPRLNDELLPVTGVALVGTIPAPFDHDSRRALPSSGGVALTPSPSGLPAGEGSSDASFPPPTSPGGTPLTTAPWFAGKVDDVRVNGEARPAPADLRPQVVCGWRPTVPLPEAEGHRIVGPPCARQATRLYVGFVETGEDTLIVAHGRCEWPHHALAAGSRLEEQPLTYLQHVDFVHVNSLPPWNPAWPMPAELRGAVEDLVECFRDDRCELIPHAPTAAHRALKLLRRCP